MARTEWLLLGLFGVLVLSAGGVASVAYWKRSTNAMRYIPALHVAEDAHEIPRDLLARVAFQESRFREDVITGQTQSAAGAQGIMQIVPRFHPTVNPLDPYAAIAYAGQYLAALFRRFGTWKLALAAYNWGPENLARNLNTPGKWPTETLRYIAEITEDVPVV